MSVINKTKRKNFVENTIYNVIYKLVNIIFPFAISIYTSRILLPYGVGKVASIQNVVAYFAMVAPLGLPNYGIKEIAKARDDISERDNVFRKLFTINVVSTTIVLAVFVICINSIGSFREEKILYYAAGLTVLFNYINFDWFYYGIEEFKYIAIRSLSIKIISFVAIFLCVQNSHDYLGYLLVSSFATVGNNIFNLIHLHTYGIQLGIDFDVKNYIKPMLILFLTALSIELYTLLDITMLNIWCSKEAIGYYTNASKITKVIIGLIVSIGGALFPRLSALYSAGEKEKCDELINRVLEVLIFFSMPALIGWCFTSDAVIVLLYGKDFEPAAITAKILSLLLLSLTFSNLFGTQVLLSVNEEHKLFISTLMGVIANVILNSLFIPVYQENGAAVASVISETTVTLATFLFARKYFTFNISPYFLGKTFISTLGLTIYLIVCKVLIPGDGLVLMIIGGSIVYLGIQVLVKNEVVVFLIQKRS